MKFNIIWPILSLIVFILWVLGAISAAVLLRVNLIEHATLLKVCIVSGVIFSGIGFYFQMTQYIALKKLSDFKNNKSQEKS